MKPTIKNAVEAGVKFYRYQGRWYADATPQYDDGSPYKKIFGGGELKSSAMRDAAQELFDAELGWMV